MTNFDLLFLFNNYLEISHICVIGRFYSFINYTTDAMREHLNKRFNEMKSQNIKKGLLEFFFKVNLIADFLPSFKTCSLFPTLRSSAEQSDIGMLIKHYGDKNQATTLTDTEKEKLKSLIRNTVLSFGPLKCNSLTGWQTTLVASTKMEQTFTPWDFFFVHYYAYFTRKILQTVGKSKQLIARDLCGITRAIAQKEGRDVFFFGEDREEKMTTFDQFTLCLPSVDETQHPYRLSTCIQMMFGSNDDDTIQNPPPYFNLDKHIPGPPKKKDYKK